MFCVEYAMRKGGPFGHQGVLQEEKPALSVLLGLLGLCGLRLQVAAHKNTLSCPNPCLFVPQVRSSIGVNNGVILAFASEDKQINIPRLYRTLHDVNSSC